MIGGQYLRHLLQVLGYCLPQFGTQCFMGISGDFGNEVLIILKTTGIGLAQLYDVVTQFCGSIARK